MPPRSSSSAIRVRGRHFLLVYRILLLYVILWSIYLQTQDRTFPSTETINIETILGIRQKIPIFYNLYVEDESEAARVMGIVSEQFAKLRPVHGPIRVHSIGHKITIPNTILIEHHESATELVTLHSLWEYCKANPSDKVGYLHSKGSYTAMPENDMLRRFLTKGVLSEECENMPSRCNVCSSRFSPVPHPHTSGNMWLTRCSYVEKLLDPFQFTAKVESFATGGYESLACDGRDRYAAERWIHSHPSVQPCDLYPFPNFTWAYQNIPDSETMPLELALAPRFDLSKYIYWPICPGRGVSREQRLEEYETLYHKTPGPSWWGWKAFETNLSLPYFELDYSLLTPELKKAAFELGYSAPMWDNGGYPFNLRGKAWKLLPSAQKVNLARLGYTEQTWNATALVHPEKDLVAIRSYVNVSKLLHDDFHHCHIKQDTGDSVVQHNKNLTSAQPPSAGTKKKKKKKKKRALVIAATPRDIRHVMAIWSELECFADGVERVVLSAPSWNAPIVEKIVAEAKRSIPKFSTAEVTLQAAYFLNNRYDVGLWCDALEALDRSSYDEIALINDSVFALREFPHIFDELEAKDVSMTSLGYSYSGKYFAGYGPEYFWLESVYRGFTQEGIQTFMNFSCVPEEHPLFCPMTTGNTKKDCIVNNFEHDLAKQFPCTKVHGLYPSDVPEFMRLDENNADGRIWITNSQYWKVLVDDFQFPVAKVNRVDEIGSALNDELLRNCTVYFNRTLLRDIDFSYTRPFYEQPWKLLPPDLQMLASEILGYNETIWNRGMEAPKLVNKKWNDMQANKRATLVKLGYSKVLWELEA